MSARRSSGTAGPDWLLLSAVAALPWAFGGVEIWAYRGAAFLVAAAWGWFLLAPKHAGRLLPADARAWLVPAAALIAWAGVQALPLPAAAVRLASPAADAVQRSSPEGTTTAYEAYALRYLPGDLPPAPEGGATLPPSTGSRGVVPTLSLAADATLESAFWWGALLLAALFIAARAGDPDRRRRYRAVLLSTCAALAAAGLLQAGTWNGKVLWIREIDGGRPFGPYINGDHFAGVMELAVPWLAGLTFARIRRSERSILTDRTALACAAGTILCLVAGLAAQSKFAAFTMVSSLSVLALVASPRPAARRRVAAALLLAGAIGVGVLAGTPLGERFRDFLVVDVAAPERLERVVAWRASLSMLADHPIAGIGYGAFGWVFPRYLPAGEAQPWAQLHNDPLEMLVSGGIVGGALFAWLAVAAIRRLTAGHRAIASGSRRLGNLGLLAGIASLGLHALVDFNHQIPANALLFVAAAAAAAPPPEGAREGGR